MWVPQPRSLGKPLDYAVWESFEGQVRWNVGSTSRGTTLLKLVDSRSPTPESHVPSPGDSPRDGRTPLSKVRGSSGRGSNANGGKKSLVDLPPRLRGAFLPRQPDVVHRYRGRRVPYKSLETHLQDREASSGSVRPRRRGILRKEGTGNRHPRGREEGVPRACRNTSPTAPPSVPGRWCGDTVDPGSSQSKYTHHDQRRSETPSSRGPGTGLRTQTLVHLVQDLLAAQTSESR